MPAAASRYRADMALHRPRACFQRARDHLQVSVPVAARMHFRHPDLCSASECRGPATRNSLNHPRKHQDVKTAPRKRLPGRVTFQVLLARFPATVRILASASGQSKTTTPTFSMVGTWTPASDGFQAIARTLCCQPENHLKLRPIPCTSEYNQEGSGVPRSNSAWWRAPRSQTEPYSCPILSISRLSASRSRLPSGRQRSKLIRRSSRKKASR